MTKITPYLLFNGNCAEAMEFYASCIGGELTMVKVADSPMSQQMPEQLQQRIINSQLVSGNMSITASDWLLPNRQPQQGNTTCVYISDATHEELTQYFDKLSQGANADTLDALKQMPFGTYGALTDKYGVRWMFQGKAA